MSDTASERKSGSSLNDQLNLAEQLVADVDRLPSVCRQLCATYLVSAADVLHVFSHGCRLEKLFSEPGFRSRAQLSEAAMDASGLLRKRIGEFRVWMLTSEEERIVDNTLISLISPMGPDGPVTLSASVLAAAGRIITTILSPNGEEINYDRINRALAQHDVGEFERDLIVGETIPLVLFQAKLQQERPLPEIRMTLPVPTTPVKGQQVIELLRRLDNKQRVLFAALIRRLAENVMDDKKSFLKRYEKDLAFAVATLDCVERQMLEVESVAGALNELDDDTANVPDENEVRLVIHNFHKTIRHQPEMLSLLTVIRTLRRLNPEYSDSMPVFHTIEAVMNRKIVGFTGFADELINSLAIFNSESMRAWKSLTEDLSENEALLFGEGIKYAANALNAIQESKETISLYADECCLSIDALKRLLAEASGIFSLEGARYASAPHRTGNIAKLTGKQSSDLIMRVTCRLLAMTGPEGEYWRRIIVQCATACLSLLRMNPHSRAELLLGRGVTKKAASQAAVLFKLFVDIGFSVLQGVLQGQPVPHELKTKVPRPMLN